MIQYLTRIKVGFSLGRHADGQSIFFRQCKPGALDAVFIDFQQAVRCRSGNQDAGVTEFKSE